MKKIVCSVLALCAVAATMSLVACSGGTTDDGLTPEEGEVIFEAEGIDLEGLSGHGYSNSAEGCGMIMGENTLAIRNNQTVLNSISNGHFVGYFNTADTTLTFNINSDVAATGATMKLRLGSEYGTMRLDPSVMTISVNGTALDYDQISVTGQRVEGTNIVYGAPFKDYEISTAFDLKAGENKIEITILQNTLGLPGTNVESVGPGVDCIKIKSESTLTWNSLWESNKEEISYEG